MKSASSQFIAVAFVHALVVIAGPLRAQPDHVPDQLCVRLDARLSDDAQKQVLAGLGLRVRYHYRHLRAFWVDTADGTDVEELGRHLSSDPRFEYAHANYYGVRHFVSVTPNDPMLPAQYGLHNTGQTISGQAGIPDADIDAPEAWCIRTDGRGALIAVIDSGVDLTHPDLVANLWQNPLEPIDNLDNDGNGLVDDRVGWDFFGNDPSPDDTNGHGTWVTGPIAAAGDNGIGIAGVCWQADVAILKDGAFFPQAAMSAAAIEWAAAHGAAVISFSSGYGAAAAPILSTAVTNAELAGTVMCVAAGNTSPTGVNIDGGSIDVPAEFTNGNLLVVAGTDNRDSPASFSNFGPMSVDVAAAAVQVRTTDLAGGYATVDGTSFSAPLAAGCVALIRAHDPTLTHQAVISLILATTDPLPAWNGLTVTDGRINLHAALSQVVPPNLFGLHFADGGGGNGSLLVTNATPFATLYIPISFAPALPVGSGPVFGLPFDALFALFNPVPPFFTTADVNGDYAFTTGGIPPGTAIQGRAVDYDPIAGAIVQMSNIATLYF